jgi:hypothetical protein
MGDDAIEQAGSGLVDEGVKRLSLKLEVRGSEGIAFQEGWRTGDMTEGGVEISTVYYADSKSLYGGCINREEAIQLRDFLNECVALWESETDA